MSALILYTTEDGKSRIQLRAKDQTVWLSQREMAELFDVSTDNIGLHLKNLYEDKELSRDATTEESSVVQTEGSREVQYNLDAILAVGYRHMRGFHLAFPIRDAVRRELSWMHSPSLSATRRNFRQVRTEAIHEVAA